MRVVLISPDFSISGGVGKHLHLLTLALVDRGLEVAVVHGAPSLPEGLPPGLSARTIPGIASGDCALNGEALRFVDRCHADLVHVHGGANYALEASLRARVPTVRTLHTLEFCPTELRYHYLTRRICAHRPGWPCLPRIGLKRCTLSKRPTVWWRQVRRAQAAHVNHRACGTLIVTSSFVRRLAVEAGCSPARVHVLPYFTPMPAGPVPLPSAPRVLFAGRLYVEKGADLLVRACAALPPGIAGLDIVGDGPERDRLRRLAERLGLADRIAFHGWQADIGPFLRAATVLVVPSRLAEPFGIVGIEAGAHARPVVAFDVGGISDWLKDGQTGYLVPPNDVTALTAKLAAIVGDDECARRLGDAGRHRVASIYTVDSHVERLLSLYRDAARG